MAVGFHVRRKARVAAIGVMAGAVLLPSLPGTASSTALRANAGNFGVLGKGVSAHKIKIAFELTLKQCGSAEAIKDVVSAQYQQEEQVLLRWFNSHVQMPDGRKLVATWTDDGGSNPGCAGVAQQDGTQVATVAKDFAALGDSAQFNGIPTFANAAATHGTIAIGNNYQLNSGANGLAAQWPYAFQTYQTAQSTLQELGWFIIKREDPGTYVSPSGVSSPRKYAAVFPDDPQDITLAHTLQAELADAPTKFGSQYKAINLSLYFVPDDPTEAAETAVPMVAQLQSHGINSVVWGVSSNLGLSVMSAFTKADYFPDGFISDYGDFTNLAIYNWVYAPQNARFLGVGTPNVTAFRIAVYPNGSASSTSKLQFNNVDISSIEAYHQAKGPLEAPNVGAPLTDFWDELATLAIGIQNAGPILNARNFAGGLLRATACQTARFFGDAQNQSPAIYWTRDDPSDVHGFTTLYWSPNTPVLYTAKGFPGKGLFQSYDGYHTFTSFDSLPATASYNTGKRGTYPGKLQLTGPVNFDTNCPANPVS